MKKLLVFLGAFLLTTGTFAQDFGKSMSEPVTVQALPKKQSVSERLNFMEGTFQIVNTTNEKVIITEEMLDLVDASRSSQEDKYVIYREGLTLFVPSKQAISSSSFVKLPLEKNNQ